MLMASIQTFHRELRSIRSKVMLLIGVFAYNEWSQVNDYSYPILLAVPLPTLTINEVVRIQRILLTTLIVGLIFYQRCLTRGMEWTINSIESCRTAPAGV
jgi:hypothetical protein